MGRKSKRGKCAKLAQKGLGNIEPEEISKAPHSFVINRGHLGKNGHELMLNFRKMMEPFTASQLKVKKQNVVKDFVNIAGPLNVTHLIVFTKSPIAMYLRLVKLPHGPTLTFKIREYSLIKDIVSSQKRPLMYEKLFEHHPLLVLNNFSGEGMHFKLMTSTFQNMFPSINVNKTNLNTIRRCLLLNYNNTDNTIDFRQYAIKVVPHGMSKAVKKLIQSKVPNLSQYQQIEDFLQKSGNLSESEVEMDTPANTVVLPQPISSRGNITSQKSAIRLYELGPRFKLQLIKIEEGIMGGEVLFHEFVSKTPEEIKILKAKIKAKKKLKDKRRTEQEMNVARKKAASNKEKAEEEAKKAEKEREDDIQYYREEVGEEPDESILPTATKRTAPDDLRRFKKKVRFSNDNQKSTSTDNHKKHDGKFVKKSKYSLSTGKQRKQDEKFSKSSKFGKYSKSAKKPFSSSFKTKLSGKYKGKMFSKNKKK